MSQFLDEKKKEIADRLKELQPLVAEYEQLERAAKALDEAGGGGKPAPRRAPRRSAASTGGTGRRGRPRGSGQRSEQALKLVQDNPGISIPELADRMGIKQNYLYRVLPNLEAEGKVRKEGRSWLPVSS